MKGSICLVDVDDDRFLVLLFRKNKDGTIIAMRLKKYENKNEKDTVYIGKPDGLKSELVVITSELYNVNLKDIVKKIMVINKEKLKEIAIEYTKLHEKDKLLHEEMHKIKKKIALAQINNVSYSKLEKRLDYILKELKYDSKPNQFKKPYKNFREVPTNGYIKVYRGGRGG
ncbi:UNVERIFIED_CONTAM: hypothetical protein Cloal_4049 [Acetivibrio alkalicellulosi]